MSSILPFDELNRLTVDVQERFSEGRVTVDDEDDIIDMLFDFFLLAYAMGNSVTSENLAFDYAPPVGEVMNVVDAKVAGKTWRDRVKDYFAKARNGEIQISGSETAMPQREGRSGSSEQSGQTETVESGGVSLEEAIIRIAETEMHRDANTAALETARKAGAKNKTWITMMDEKVRDTHQYLEGMTVGIDEDFWTYDNDHAPAPGMFEFAENNVNCRCELVFS